MTRIAIFAVTIAVVIGALLAVGCGTHAQSTCAGLGSGKDGPTREQYMPCAAEMMALLDRLATQAEAAASGDRQAESETAQIALDLERLMTQAGGGQKMTILQWRNDRLRILNYRMFNAYGQYSTIPYVLNLAHKTPSSSKDRTFAAGIHGQLAANLSEGKRSYEDARQLYQQLQ